MRRAVGFGLALACLSGPGGARATPDRWIVSDLARVAWAGVPDSMGYKGRYSPELGVTAPSGRSVATIVHEGDPSTGMVRSKLYVVSAGDIASGTMPNPLISMQTRLNSHAIGLLRWLDDGRLIFAGTGNDDAVAIYTLDVRSRVLKRLLRVDGELVWFGSEDATNVVVHTRHPLPSFADGRCAEGPCRINTRAIMNITGPRSDSRVQFIDLDNGTTKVIAPPADAAGCDDSMSLSPNGRAALWQCRVPEHDFPVAWLQYKLPGWMPWCAEARGPHCVRWTYQVDLASGTVKRLTGAPTMRFGVQAPWPVWIDHGAGVILPVGAAPDSFDGFYSGIFDFNSGQSSYIRLPATGIEAARTAKWDETEQVLGLSQSETSPAILALQRGRSWKIVAPLPVNTPQIVMSIAEGANSPPRLIFQAKGRLRKSLVMDINPWIAAKQKTPVSTLSWQVEGSGSWQGGLYLPPMLEAGRKYPLVLLTHGFDPNRYSPSGYAWNFPAQALAARDLIVLQIDEGIDEADPNRWSTYQKGYEAAIDLLASKGLIDRDRVGIVGWSATGPSTSYTLVHSNYPFAAAAFTDGGVYGLYNLVSEGAPAALRGTYGTSPVGTGLASWLNAAPDLQAQRIQTPFLIWQTRWPEVAWDWYVALRSNDKPVEYWFSRGATHDVSTVQDRLFLNQLLVDWFTFWLRHEERTAIVSWGGETPKSLNEQYERWRVLREQQNDILKQPRPPLLEWTATPIPGSAQPPRSTSPESRAVTTNSFN